MRSPSIVEPLTRLSDLRPVFHSEADFMHAFATEIGGGGDVRLERALEGPNGPIYPDIWLLGTGHLPALVVEVKYKADELDATISRERFRLKYQGAQDTGRYDFLLDVERLELVGRHYPDAALAAVLLTNDHLYWTPPKTKRTKDATFRLHDGRTITGTLDWAPSTGAGTKKGRERPIHLEGIHRIEWRDYSDVRDKDPNASPPASAQFRYVLLEIR